MHQVRCAAVHCNTDVNLPGILGDADAHPQGLVGGENWVCWEGPNPSQKKMIFSLEMACFGEF